MPNPRRLDPAAILETIRRLERRIGDRFPESGLRMVAQELVGVADESCKTVAHIRRPILVIRIAVWLMLAAVVLLLLSVPTVIGKLGHVDTVLDFVAYLEPTLGAMFFIGAFCAFLVSIEIRIKRGRAMRAIRELRAVAHVVDMHQLTKDPAIMLSGGPATASSPERKMSEFELGRYYDYCTEMLSLISKIAALYVQDFPDHVATAAVDEIEDLTTGLSRKIWQKIMLLKGGPSAARQ